MKPLKINQNHRRRILTNRESRQQARARVGILARLSGLGSAEKSILNLIAGRLNKGIVLSDRDFNCLNEIWQKHRN